MERQEIISGLKHAVERGYTIELAIQSFINAGYNRQDVEDSAKLISGGVISDMNLPQTQQPKPTPVIQLPQTQVQQPQTQQLKTMPVIQSPQTQQIPPKIQPQQQSQQPKQPMPLQQVSKFPKQPSMSGINPEKISNVMVIILVLILLFLLAVLGVVIFARETILGWFS